MNTPKFRIAHVGINHTNSEDAIKTTEQLCTIFGLEPNDETPTHIFAGDLFEVKKNMQRGTVGHVAMETDDVEAAIEYLAEKGIEIQPNTIRRDADGKIFFVFLKLEIAGFAFHLCQNK